MNRIYKISFVLLLAASLVLFAGCVSINLSSVKTGPLETLNKVLEPDGEESLNIDIKMGVGELKVAGGSDKLFEGDFLYNVQEWKPEFRYSKSGKSGILKIFQPSSNNTINVGNTKYEWTLSLNNDVPTELEIDLGVGKSEINLRGLNLTDLDMEIGVGEVTLDLSGQWAQSFDASIQGGVGSATVYLPESVGVKVNLDGGIGNVETDGLKKDGNAYYNDSYDTSDVKLTLDIKAGIGEIKLKVKD